MKRAVIIVVVLLAGCTLWMNAKIDGSSKRKYTRSLRSIKAKLSPEQNQKLDAALEILMLPDSSDNCGPLEALTQIRNAGTIDAGFLAVVNGKTPNEIISLAMSKTRQKQQKRLDAINAELGDLYKKRASFEESTALLAHIVVADASLYWVDGPVLPEPMVDLKVTNNSGIALSQIIFHGTLYGPERALPWIDEDFVCVLKKRLESGETRRLKIGPRIFSDWGIEEARGKQSAAFSVTVVNAKDANAGDVVVPFDGRDAERVQELREMKSELKRLLRVY